MIIACDADGVTCNLHDPWYGRYNRDYNDNLTSERVKSWDIHKYVKPECGLKIYDYLHEPDLYAEVRPIEGALEGVQALRDAGHRVLFTSACAWGMTDQKAEWFRQYGFITGPKTPMLPSEFIPVQNKLDIDADLLIDDRASTVREWVEKKHKRALLFSYPHNQSLTDEVPSAFWQWAVRVGGWNEIVGLIDFEFRRPVRGVTA